MSQSVSKKRKASRILYPVRKAKSHYVYDRREVMKLYDVNRNTIANWESSGLARVEGTNALFRGDLLNAFHKNRKNKARKNCRPGEFYCLGCKQLRSIVGQCVTYHAQVHGAGVLLWVCPHCETQRNVFQAYSQVQKLTQLGVFLSDESAY